MKHSFKKLGKNLIVTWGLSYMLIIVILLGVISVIVTMYRRTFEQESSEFNTYVFENVTSSANDILLNMSNLHLSLVRNNNLTRFLDDRSLFLRPNELTYTLLDDIKAYNEFAVNIDLFFVYLKEEDSVLSPHGIVSSKIYYNTYFSSPEVPFEDWRQGLTNRKNDQYVTMYYKNEDGRLVEALAFVFQLPLEGEKATGVILCDKSHFVAGIRDIEWKNLCDIYIYNANGNLMIYEKKSEGTDMPRTLRDVEKYKNGEYAVYTSDVSVSKYNWKVVTIVKNDVLNRRITAIHLVAYTITFCAVICLFFLVRFLVHLHYHPIKTMLSLFGVATKKNEYDVLYESINKMLDKNRKLANDSETSRKKLMSFTLSRVIKGNVSSMILEQNSISFKGDYFAVLSFYLADISELFSDDEDMPDYERHFHLSFIIGNVMEELFAEKGFDVYTTEIDELIVCLINMNTELSAQNIKPLAEEGLSFLNEYFQISLTFALSDVQKGLTNISHAYGQTLEVLEYKRILDIDEPMLYTEIQASSGNRYLFNFHREQALVNSIKSGRRDNAIKLVEQIFTDLGKDKSLPIDYITYVVLDIASTITKSANEVMAENFQFDTELTLYRNIKNSESLANIHQLMIKYIETVCDNIDSDIKNKQSRARGHVNEIVNHVHENYTNPDLNISTIAHHFDLTPSYLSRIFKDEIGISLVDYINRYRFEQSRDLIKSGKYSIKEVSQMVGFSNDRTFYRIQKKYGKV